MKERNSAATSRENEKPTVVGEQTGGELAAAPCSAQGNVTEKQDSGVTASHGWDESKKEAFVKFLEDQTKHQQAVGQELISRIESLSLKKSDF